MTAPQPLTLSHFAISGAGDAIGCDGCRKPLGPYHYVTGRSDGHIFCCDECEAQHPNVNTPTERPT